MGYNGKVKDWIQWSREHLPNAGDYPKIDDNKIDWVWLNEVGLLVDWDGRSNISREELLDCFQAELAHNLGDVPARFTALHLYHALCRYESMFSEDEAREVRSGYKKDFSFLVRLLPVENCIDLRLIRWEILNAYAIRDWDRALELYNQIEKHR